MLVLYLLVISKYVFCIICGASKLNLYISNLEIVLGTFYFKTISKLILNALKSQRINEALAL